MVAAFRVLCRRSSSDESLAGLLELRHGLCPPSLAAVMTACIARFRPNNWWPVMHLQAPKNKFWSFPSLLLPFLSIPCPFLFSPVLEWFPLMSWFFSSWVGKRVAYSLFGWSCSALTNKHWMLPFPCYCLLWSVELSVLPFLNGVGWRAGMCPPTSMKILRKYDFAVWVIIRDVKVLMVRGMCGSVC